MKLILASDINGGIGYKNSLPWNNLFGDLKRFKTLTYGQIVVMGRNTWESLPKKPLNGRLNFVITSQNLSLPNGAIALPNLNHFTFYKNVWLIGGATLIESAWDLITEVHLSRAFTQYNCDKFFDLVRLENLYTRSSVETKIDHTYEIWNKNATIP